QHRDEDNGQDDPGVVEPRGAQTREAGRQHASFLLSGCGEYRRILPSVSADGVACAAWLNLGRRVGIAAPARLTHGSPGAANWPRTRCLWQAVGDNGIDREDPRQ